jgi:hypothetical protein
MPEAEGVDLEAQSPASTVESHESRAQSRPGLHGFILRAASRLEGETCNGMTEVCRQGLTCKAGRCVAVESLGIEAKSCSAP